MKVVEPYYVKKTIVQHLEEDKNVKTVGIVFFHGIGDCIQFMNVYDKLKEKYPNIKFDLLIQAGLGQKVLFPDAIETGLDEAKKMNYDYLFLVHFPVETDPTCTKSELCCKLEVGVEPTSGHKQLQKYPSKLIAVHFQNTALPDVLNCPKEVAEKIWKEIIDAGFIPTEVHFEHVFHNPKNAKYEFITNTVRGCKPDLTTLIGLLYQCRGAICAVSGPLHIALSIMPERTMFIQNSVPSERFTYHKVPVIDTKNYKKGVVKKWLEKLT